jgi:DNA-binding Lrp family transcriptional regulator
MNGVVKLDAVDRALIVATQGGLPLVARPYHVVGEKVGIAGEEVIARLRALLETGVIRRIGAVPNHYAIGWTANGMTVWDVVDERVDELGLRVGSLDFVTHCYRRPRALPAWPYNLFAMVHGNSRDEVRDKAARVAALLGEASRGGDILFSTRILKKAGLRI